MFHMEEIQNRVVTIDFMKNLKSQKIIQIHNKQK